MNTDKTLKEQFTSNTSDYPIWYYKQLEEIEVEDVIFNLLKETFVVELNNKKIVMTFGKNRKHEIGCAQSCDEGLDYTSYETIRKSFTEGKWFRVTGEDTSDEFKKDYRDKESERRRLSMRESRINILEKAIGIIPSISIDEKSTFISALQDMTDDDLKELTEAFFSKFKKIN